jgi:hypothetical protein
MTDRPRRAKPLIASTLALRTPAGADDGADHGDGPSHDDEPVGDDHQHDAGHAYEAVVGAP